MALPVPVPTENPYPWRGYGFGHGYTKLNPYPYPSRVRVQNPWVLLAGRAVLGVPQSVTLICEHERKRAVRSRLCLHMSTTQATVWGIARANGARIWRRRCEGEGEVDEATALTIHVCHRRRRRRRRVWRDEVVGYSEGGCDVRLASSLRG